MVATGVTLVGVNEISGRIITATREYPNARVSMSDGVITAIEELYGTGATTWVPGFVDVHNHGGNGGAFPTGSFDDCLRAASYHRAHGTTTLLASMVSGTREELCAQASTLADVAAAGHIAGIHMEGPFINAGKCGAQDPSRICDGDPDFFRAVIDAARGHLRMITFAPETPNATALLELCASYGIIASLGHTEADYSTVSDMVAAGRQMGVTMSATHLFNAMPPLHHREPGAAGALLSATRAGEVFVELVADGIHLHDAVVDIAYCPNALAVTDAMEAAGLSDGHYQLGSLDVQVVGGVARVAGGGFSGAIAGGTSTLAQQFARFAQRHNLTDAVRFTSTTAAKLLGREDIGDIAVGMRADLVELDEDLNVVQGLAGGSPLS